MNKQQALWACFELGLVKLELRKWIYRDRKDKIEEIMDECIQRALEKYDDSVKDLTSVYNKHCEVHKYVYVPGYFEENEEIYNKFILNTNNTILTLYTEEIIKQPLSYIIFLTMNTTYTIVDSEKGPFYFIPYIYNQYAILEPLEKTYKLFTEKDLVEYIKQKYTGILYTLELL